MVCRQTMLRSYRLMVVDFAIVAEPQEGELLDAQGLHAIQLVHDGQAVEAEAAVGEAVDVLEAKGVGAPVSDLHGIGALHSQALIAAKQGPNTTHLHYRGGGGELGVKKEIQIGRQL